MTLREMIAAHPDAFYEQSWYEGEAFLDKPMYGGPIPRPRITHKANLLWRVRRWFGVRQFYHYSAADLAWLWLDAFDNPVRGDGQLWSYYLWTSDTDSQGQRVYVGQNGKGLEIHRHLHLTDRWRVPV